MSVWLHLLKGLTPALAEGTQAGVDVNQMGHFEAAMQGASTPEEQRMVRARFGPRLTGMYDANQKAAHDREMARLLLEKAGLTNKGLGLDIDTKALNLDTLTQTQPDKIEQSRLKTELDQLGVDTGTFNLDAGRQKLPLELEALTAQIGQRQAAARKSEADALAASQPETPEELEIVRLIEEYRKSGDPIKGKAADAMEMEMYFGGKPPEAYVKSRGALQSARVSTSNLYQLIRDKKDQLFKPDERAHVKQEADNLVLMFADLLNRGANFTETEQDLIKGMLGGDPLSTMGRTLRSRQSYLSRLQRVGEIIERRGEELIKSYTSPSTAKHTYPWQEQATVNADDITDEEIDNLW